MTNRVEGLIYFKLGDIMSEEERMNAEMEMSEYIDITVKCPTCNWERRTIISIRDLGSVVAIKCKYKEGDNRCEEVYYIRPSIVVTYID